MRILRNLGFVVALALLAAWPAASQMGMRPPDFRGVDQPEDRGPVPAEIPAKATFSDQATVVVTGHNPGERRAELIRRTHRPATTLPEQRRDRHDTAQRV